MVHDEPGGAAPAPAGAVSGSSTSTAGRLLQTLARTAASAAMASSAGSDVPAGSSGRSAVPSPLRTTAATTMTAAGPAATASGQPCGLITAQASTASRASKETGSAMAALSGPSLQPALMYPYRAMANSRNRSVLTMDSPGATLVP
jgi:hypothetical protein